MYPASIHLSWVTVQFAGGTSRDLITVLAVLSFVYLLASEFSFDFSQLAGTGWLTNVQWSDLRSLCPFAPRWGDVWRGDARQGPGLGQDGTRGQDELREGRRPPSAHRQPSYVRHGDRDSRGELRLESTLYIHYVFPKWHGPHLFTLFQLSASPQLTDEELCTGAVVAGRQMDSEEPCLVCRKSRITKPVEPIDRLTEW